jgi:hypothetical protein
VEVLSQLLSGQAWIYPLHVELFKFLALSKVIVFKLLDQALLLNHIDLYPIFIELGLSPHWGCFLWPGVSSLTVQQLRLWVIALSWNDKFLSHLLLGHVW